MQNSFPDERYSVADEAILGAFFKLLKKKTPDQITVSDITKTAGIARSTFYNHYQDIPSLGSAVEEKTILSRPLPGRLTSWSRMCSIIRSRFWRGCVRRTRRA